MWLLTLNLHYNENLDLFFTSIEYDYVSFISFPSILQSGRCLPKCHLSGRLHHDSDGAGLERRTRSSEGCPTLRRPQRGLPAPAPGVWEHPGRWGVGRAGESRSLRLFCLLWRSVFVQFRDWLQTEYRDSPFNDEAHIRDLLAKASKVNGDSEGMKKETSIPPGGIWPFIQTIFSWPVNLLLLTLSQNVHHNWNCPLNVPGINTTREEIPWYATYSFTIVFFS